VTSTKNHVWINVHFPKDVHASLKAWCIRNGRSMQDGLVEMVALMSGPNGLRLTQPTAVVPTVLRAPDPLPRAATPAPVRAAPPKPAPAPEPRGFRPGSAGQIYRDCFGEPPPGTYDEHGNTIDTPSPDDSIDANEYSDEYGDDTGGEEEASEPDADARDARPH